MKRHTLSPCVAAALAVALAPGIAQAAVACTDSILTDDSSLNPSYESCTGSFAGNLPETAITYAGTTFASIGKTGNDGTGSGPFGTDFNAGVLSFDQA